MRGDFFVRCLFPPETKSAIRIAPDFAEKCSGMQLARHYVYCNTIILLYMR